jgi:transposase
MADFRSLRAQGMVSARCRQGLRRQCRASLPIPLFAWIGRNLPRAVLDLGMRGYPIELRERVVRAVERREGTIERVAKLFMVGTTFIYKLFRQKEETGSIAPKPHGGGIKPMLDAPKLESLRQLVEEQPDATLEELQHKLQEQAQVKPSLPILCRALQKLGLPRKKKRFFAQERNAKKRRKFLKKVQELDPAKLVFIDEMGANINLSRLYARAPKGKRVEEALPRDTPTNMSVAGALGSRKLLATCCLEGAFDGEAFVAFIERMVVPQLHTGDTVLMDNVPTHQSAKVKAAIESTGAQLLNLPPYSPDLDPIEPCWSKVKAHLRKVKARTVDRLYQAIASGIKSVKATDIHGWFAHCGYSFAAG